MAKTYKKSKKGFWKVHDHGKWLQRKKRVSNNTVSKKSQLHYDIMNIIAEHVSLRQFTA